MGKRCQNKEKNMKVSRFNNHEFRPIDITITIESEEELIELWHRTNFSMQTLKDTLYASNSYAYQFETNTAHVLWGVLEDLRKFHNINK